MLKVRKRIIFGLILMSLVLLACACNMGDYFSNILDRVQEELGSEIEIAGTVPLDEMLEDLPEELEEIVPETEEEVIEDEAEIPSVTTEGWLIAATNSGIWATDDEGAGFHQVYAGQYLMQSTAAGSGGNVAFIQSETEYGDGMLNLGLVHLADDHVSIVSALTNDATTHAQGGDGNIGEPSWEAARAVMFDNLAWSPDARYLAFIGAQHDQFADLFVFDVESGEINRLVGGESHQYHPAWSPDSQFVLAPSATSFGTGAGFGMDAMWIARPDGSEGQPLYDASSSIDQEIWGWMDANTMLFSPVDIMAGYKHLQLMDIHTGAVEEVSGVSDYFYDADLSPSAGTVMFSFPFDDILDWMEGETITERGLYLYRRDTGALEQISDTVDYGSWVEWDERTQCYYAYLSLPVGGASGYVQPYSPYGKIDGSCPMLPVGVTAMPEFSPSGEYYFWNATNWSEPENSSVSIGVTATGDSTVLQQGVVSYAIWHPSNDTVFFVLDRTLYQASAPDFVPVYLGETDTPVTALYWAMP